MMLKMSDHQQSRDSYFAVQAAHVEQCAKEARMALSIWMVTLVTIVTVMVSAGYVPIEQRPNVPPLIWGIPSWVFWGLFVPWFVLIAISWWFAVCYLKDDSPAQEFPDSATVEAETESAH